MTTNTEHPILTHAMVHSAGDRNNRQLTSTEAARLRARGVPCSTGWRAVDRGDGAARLYRPIPGTCSLENTGHVAYKA